MNRTPIPLIVLGPDGRTLAGATVAVRNRVSGSTATVYQAETGGATIGNPLTSDDVGRVVGWVDRGAYEATVSKSPTLAPYIVAWDSAPAADGAADEPWIDPAIARDAELAAHAALGETAHPLTVVTSLPGSPVDGQRCLFRPVTNTSDPNYPVLWLLRYNAGSPSPYKWEPVGAPASLADELATSQGTTSTSYTNLGTTGPQITIPLGGDYDVQIEGLLISANEAQDAMMSYAIGATAAVDADSIRHRAGSVNGQSSVSRSKLKPNLSSGAVLLTKYKLNGSGTATFEQRRIRVTPRRVA